MAYLIDTDIIVYSLKGNESVAGHFELHREIPKFISAVSYGELIYGARKSAHVEKNVAVARRVAELFPVIDIDTAVMEIFGEVKSTLEASGKVIDDMDLLIASTALFHNLILVTNNVKHFKKVPDVRIENWARR